MHSSSISEFTSTEAELDKILQVLVLILEGFSILFFKILNEYFQGCKYVGGGTVDSQATKSIFEILYVALKVL